MQHVALRFVEIDHDNGWAQLQVEPQPAVTIRLIMVMEDISPEDLKEWDAESPTVYHELDRWRAVLLGGSETNLDEKGVFDRSLHVGGIGIEIAVVVIQKEGHGE